MNWQRFQLEIFHLRKAFWQHRRGWSYLNNRFWLNRLILSHKQVLEKPVNVQDLSIHTMLGSQHLLMALWSLGSFNAVSRTRGQMYLHSDGSLTQTDTRLLLKFFPSAIIIDSRQVVKDYQLRYDQYPAIKQFRLKHADNFFVTKLLDPMMVSEKKYLLFFDIDILWFKHPDLIERELASGCPRSWMMLATPADEPGQSNTVYFQDGSKLPDVYSQFNGGIMLFRKENLPLSSLRTYVETIDMTRLESQHWVEQAGYAYNLQNLQPLPQLNYVIKGPATSETVAKHYTGPRRVGFYTEGLPLVKRLIWNE